MILYHHRIVRHLVYDHAEDEAVPRQKEAAAHHEHCSQRMNYLCTIDGYCLHLHGLHNLHHASTFELRPFFDGFFLIPEL